MCHHTIVVTTYGELYSKTAYNAAIALFGDLVSSPVESHMNGYFSFFIAPDGSKEGWDESDIQDVQRDKFIAWLNEQRFEDGSSPYKWFEAAYGDDNGNNVMTRHEDMGYQESADAS